ACSAAGASGAGCWMVVSFSVIVYSSGQRSRQYQLVTLSDILLREVLTLRRDQANACSEKH
ncbi:MAG: hypothetical protein J6K46_07325, partial [Sutterella sp.]|nr:hypothetical protein [Sutterella sp.]